MKHIKRMNEALEEISRKDLRRKEAEDFTEEDLSKVNSFLKQNYEIYKNSPFYSLTAKITYGCIAVNLEIDRVPFDIEFKKKTGYEKAVNKIRNVRITPVKILLCKEGDKCIIYDDPSNTKQIVRKKVNKTKYYKCDLSEMLSSLKILLDKEEDVIKK